MAQRKQSEAVSSIDEYIPDQEVHWRLSNLKETENGHRKR